MQSKLFVVIAEDPTVEQIYFNIIHREYPFAPCVTSYDLVEQYGTDCNTLSERIHGLFRSPDFRFVNIAYFLIFPPDNAGKNNKAWTEQLNNFHIYLNKLAPEMNRLISVWSIGEIQVSNAFLPHYRSYTDHGSLEFGLKCYVRAQKRYNPDSVANNPIPQKLEEVFNENLAKDELINKYISKDYLEERFNNTYKEKFFMSKVITIFSSSEADQYVTELQCCMNHVFVNRRLDFTCISWRDAAIFGTGADTINALIDYARIINMVKGYAIFFFAPDDTANIRGQDYYMSRDNVWLEYGLFAAILSPSHVFAVFPKNPVDKNGLKQNWHHPTDFATQRKEYPYSDKIEDIRVHFESTANNIADIIGIQLNRDIEQTSNSFDDPIRFRPHT